MKVIFESNRIKIRRSEGVVLVIDNNIRSDIYEIVKNQATELDIPFKLGALSHKEELTGNDIECLDQKIKNRGKFITPLIEGFLQKLPDKGYDLIILHSGRIYDLGDFKAELASKFNKIITKQDNYTLEEWREIFKSEIFNFFLDSVSVSLLSPAVPSEWDDDFSLSLNKIQKQFFLTRTLGKKKQKIDLNLKIRGKSDAANIEIQVDNSKFKGMIKNDKGSIVPQWGSISKEDIEVFKEHHEAYKKSNFIIKCPLCKKAHRFEKPFCCNKQSGDISDILFGDKLILKSVCRYKSGFILFQYEDEKIKFLASEKEILEFENLRFVFVPKSNIQVYEVMCGESSLEIREAIKLYNNLYELEEGKIIYLV